MNELALFNHLFNGFDDDGYDYPTQAYRKYFQMPKVDVKEDDNAYTLEMDIPGKTEKDLKIELHKNVLTISSEDETKEVKKDDSGDKKDKKDKAKWILKERTFSQFSRSFTLPDDVDGDALEAICKNGVLSIKMPRKALTQPRRIAITSA